MKKTILLCIFVFSLIFQAFLTPGVGANQLTLEATYSTDVKNNGTKYYHDGNDWVGRSSSGILRTANRWDISGIDPSWDIVSVEVRFYGEAKTGSPGTISLTRYGTSHGEDNPETDTGAQTYSKINGTPYASLPEPSSGSWTSWINLGSTAVSDITWCRDSGLSTWALGLKASDAIETSTIINHIDFSEDNEANDAELRITYTSTTSSNQSPTATITSITPNPATVGQTVTFTGSGTDPDGTITAYEWTSSINGLLSAASTFSTSVLSAGTHTISLRVKDNNEAWSTPVTRSLTINTSTSGTLENIYICLGYRVAWEWNAKAGLEYLLRTMGALKIGDVWRYVNQNTKKEFLIRFVEDINSMKLALQEERSHVLFMGHSNYGLGPVFATIEEVQNQYIEDIYWIDDTKIFNISSPWIAFSPRSMRTGHAFPDWWPFFQDGTSGIMPYDFSDPNIVPAYNYYLTYRIPGDPNLYKVETVHNGAIERFPDSQKPAWYSPDGRPPNPANPEELQYFLINLEPQAPPVNVVGEWTWSREVSGYFKENYFYRPAGTGQNKVEWLFTIQEPGNYKISARWPAASHHTAGARYTVNHSTGSSSFVVDQRINGGQWNEFGQFYFEPGNYSIILSDEAASGRVVADGVKITAVSGILDKEIDNMVYPPPHYGNKTVMFRKDLDIQKESLRYDRLFYDSCNSGNYYLDTLNRGLAFFTLDSSSLLGFNAYLKAYLEGKSNHEIWTIIQSYSPIYDYYDFNKLPSQQ